MDQALNQILTQLAVRIAAGEKELVPQFREVLWKPIDSYFRRYGIPDVERDLMVDEFLDRLVDERVQHYELRTGSLFWSWLCKVMSNDIRTWYRERDKCPIVSKSGWIDDEDRRRELTPYRIERESARMRLPALAVEKAMSKLVEKEDRLLRSVYVIRDPYVEVAQAQDLTLSGRGRTRRANQLKTQTCRLKERLRRQLVMDPHIPREFFGDASKRGISRLAREHAHAGQGVMPVKNYLRALAKHAKVDLPIVLAPFDLGPDFALSLDTTPKIARVLRAVGCSLTQAQLMMRASFAEEHGVTVTAQLQVAYRAATLDQFETADAILLAEERRYPVRLACELDDLKRLLEGEYTK